MAALLLTGARLLDVVTGETYPGMSILIEGERIARIAEGGIIAPGATHIDLAGRTVMPGLIDAHVHAIAVADSFPAIASLSPYLVGARALRVLSDMLSRGYTTVRDAGGADAGLAAAVQEGPIYGPRLFPSGLALAQRNGQGDFGCGPAAHPGCPVCHGRRTITRVVNGQTELRAAVREELGNGATQIKLMASGGILSGIPMEQPHFTRTEIAVAVAEAKAAGTYVMAHAYESCAIDNCIAAGVRSIEHATLLSPETAKRLAAAGAGIVPTLAVFAVLHDGAEDQATRARMSHLLQSGLESIDIARSAGVITGHGTDLHHTVQHRQPEELLLRRLVMNNLEIIQAATLGNAAIMGIGDEIGSITEGRIADLIVLNGDPIENIEVLCTPDRNLAVVVRGGMLCIDRVRHGPSS